MNETYRQRIARIAQDAGFDITIQVASDGDMRDGIRQVERLEHGVALTELQRLGLIENLRLALQRTASKEGAAGSVLAQSRLARWRFLRAASPAAADAYVAVLGHFGLNVPDYLRDASDR